MIWNLTFIYLIWNSVVALFDKIWETSFSVSHGSIYFNEAEPTEWYNIPTVKSYCDKKASSKFENFGEKKNIAPDIVKC